jgi:WD40 repeat protein
MPGLKKVMGEPGTINPVRLDWATVLPESIADLAWSEDGGTLYAGSADGVLTAYQGDGDWRFRCQAHAKGITAVRVQPRGCLVATAGEDGRMCVLDGTTGERRGEADTGSSEGHWADHLDWSPDGGVLAGTAGRTLHLRHEDGRDEAWDGHPGSIEALAWAPTGRRLASGANKGVYLWNIGSWKPVKVLEFPGATVSLAWSRDGRALAAGTQDGFLHIRLQVPGTTPRRLTMSGYPGKVSALAWHPGRAAKQLRIATCGGSDVVVWTLDTRRGGKQARPLRRHDRTVTALGWSGNAGEWLASGDRRGRLCLWDASDSPVFETNLGAEITQLRWHPEQASLAVGCVDGTLRLFSLGGDQASPGYSHATERRNQRT